MKKILSFIAFALTIGVQKHPGCATTIKHYQELREGMSNFDVYANNIFFAFSDQQFEEGKKNPVDIVKDALEYAKENRLDTVIVDTAGRLQIDEALMQELKDLKSGVKPHEILLVVDSMTGQDAVNVAQSFSDAVGIDGVILTKLDGDTRGGAALSVKKVTGKPIKFAATGEKLSDIEEFKQTILYSYIKINKPEYLNKLLNYYGKENSYTRGGCR